MSDSSVATMRSIKNNLSSGGRYLSLLGFLVCAVECFPAMHSNIGACLIIWFVFECFSIELGLHVFELICQAGGLYIGVEILP